MSDDTGSRVGTDFGHYHLRRLLGRGGMGEVYEAEDTRKDRIVALKLLPVAMSHDPVFRKRLQREARSAGRLQEPHVVPIHDYGEIDGVLYVDMRLIEGTDLRKMLSRYGPLTPARAVAIISQIGSALDAAHESGIMHRDVKPENILITRDDFAYLVDFGIANAATDESLTELGTAVGTYAYMAPERFKNDEVTYRADIYALACVLHECLTGGQPYPADSVSVVITAHLMSPIPAPSKIRPGIPAAFDDVIARGMAKDPKDRHATAGDLAAAAHNALESREQDAADTILARSSAATIPAVITPPPTQDPPTRPASFLTPPPSYPRSGAATPPPLGPPPTPPPWQALASGPMPSARPPARNWALIILAAAVAFLAVLGGAVAVALLTNKSGNKHVATGTGTTSRTTTAESSEPETTTSETTSVQPPVTGNGKWTVIAYSPAKGVFGWSIDADTLDDASNAAIGECKQYGGTDCQLAAQSPGQCVAVARSDTSWHGGLGPTIQAAESDAIAENKGGTIVASKCSS